MLTEEDKNLAEIFFGYDKHRRTELSDKNLRLVHYTSAENAAKIVATKNIWMRNALSVNDFSEIEHGNRCFNHAYDGHYGARFRVALDSVHKSLSEELYEYINGWNQHDYSNTYITCLSEHRTPDDDPFGRLSMWRAYGRNQGVALVLNNSPFLKDGPTMNVSSSAVLYADENEFSKQFLIVTEKIENSLEFLSQVERKIILGYALSMVRYAKLSTKHPGFKEEREWRLIYCPVYDKSDHIRESIEVVGDILQTVYKFPLINNPQEGVTGIEIPEILDKIIIGPTEHYWIVYEAFKRLLSEAGVENPGEKITLSRIPLRSN